MTTTKGTIAKIKGCIAVAVFCFTAHSSAQQLSLDSAYSEEQNYLILPQSNTSLVTNPDSVQPVDQTVYYPCGNVPCVTYSVAVDFSPFWITSFVVPPPTTFCVESLFVVAPSHITEYAIGLIASAPTMPVKRCVVHSIANAAYEFHAITF